VTLVWLNGIGFSFVKRIQHYNGKENTQELDSQIKEKKKKNLSFFEIAIFYHFLFFLFPFIPSIQKLQTPFTHIIKQPKFLL